MEWGSEKSKAVKSDGDFVVVVAIRLCDWCGPVEDLETVFRVELTTDGGTLG